VQWLDATGAWHNVDGWQGNLDIAEGSRTPFKQWAVMTNNYGQGPFRWVVYAERGGAVWGVSPNFNLPKYGGLDGMMFLSIAKPPVVQKPVEAIDPLSVVPAGAPMLKTETTTMRFTCDDPICDHGHITAYITGAPAKAWVGVQWLDATGAWHNVDGWQGNLDIAEGSRTPFKQWAVMTNNYGQGPFRWVVYAERGGAVWGVSPNFNLPKYGGLNSIMFLSR
jgi:hypothetical protein